MTKFYKPMDLKSRSQLYQFHYYEVDCGEYYQEMVENHGIPINDPINSNIEVRLLKEQLYDRMIELANLHLTKKKLRIFTLILEGYTQVEVAKIIGISQSTVAHCINGINQYVKNAKGEIMTYPCDGIYVKLKKFADSDEKTQNILKQIQKSMDNSI